MTEKKENPTRNQPLLYSGLLLPTYYNRMLFTKHNLYIYLKIQTVKQYRKKSRNCRENEVRLTIEYQSYRINTFYIIFFFLLYF